MGNGITMTVEDIIRQEREINKLREKLRKAEARAEQAENKAERLDGYYAGVWWVVTRVLVQNGESRAIPLIKHLWSCNKADVDTNTRLRREKAAWKKERLELLEEIEQLKAEVRAIAEGVVVCKEDVVVCKEDVGEFLDRQKELRCRRYLWPGELIGPDDFKLEEENESLHFPGHERQNAAGDRT